MSDSVDEKNCNPEHEIDFRIVGQLHGTWRSKLQPFERLEFDDNQRPIGFYYERRNDNEPPDLDDYTLVFGCAIDSRWHPNYPLVVEERNQVAGSGGCSGGGDMAELQEAFIGAGFFSLHYDRYNELQKAFRQAREVIRVEVIADDELEVTRTRQMFRAITRGDPLRLDETTVQVQRFVRVDL